MTPISYSAVACIDHLTLRLNAPKAMWALGVIILNIT